MKNEKLKGKQQAKHNESTFHQESWEVKKKVSKVGHGRQEKGMCGHSGVQTAVPSLGSCLKTSGFYFSSLIWKFLVYLVPTMCQPPYKTLGKTAV